MNRLPFLLRVWPRNQALFSSFALNHLTVSPSKLSGHRLAKTRSRVWILIVFHLIRSILKSWTFIDGIYELMYCRTRTQTHWKNACHLVRGWCRFGGLLSSPHHITSIFFPNCIMHHPQEISLHVRGVRVDLESCCQRASWGEYYLLTHSPLRILIHGFFALICFTYYSVLSHPDSHIASIITLFKSWK